MLISTQPGGVCADLQMVYRVTSRYLNSQFET